MQVRATYAITFSEKASVRKYIYVSGGVAREMDAAPSPPPPRVGKLRSCRLPETSDDHDED